LEETKQNHGKFTIARKVRVEAGGLLTGHSQPYFCMMSGLVARWVPTARMRMKSEPSSKRCQTWKKFTSECYDQDLSMFFLVKSELAEKGGCSLCTKSLHPCIVLYLSALLRLHW